MCVFVEVSREKTTGLQRVSKSTVFIKYLP